MENTLCESCGNDTNKFVKCIYTNNTEHIREQCQSCGKLHSKSYKKINFNLTEVPYMSKLLKWKYTVNVKDVAKIKNVLYQYQAKHQERQWNYYFNKYLKSDEWQHKRQLIMGYYNWTCQECGAEAKDLHHITYDNIFKEKFEDLQPLCRNCHTKKHKL